MSRSGVFTLLRVGALALPLVGLAAAWAIAHDRAQQGVEWEVPIAGFDPRDLLRGHYIVYRYDWPGLAAGVSPSTSSALCLKGTPPRIEVVGPLDRACAHPIRAPHGSSALAAGRLYVPQDKAAALERQLADRSSRAVLRMRVRADGSITPLRIEFRPRGEP